MTTQTRKLKYAKKKKVITPNTYSPASTTVIVVVPDALDTEDSLLDFPELLNDCAEGLWVDVSEGPEDVWLCVEEEDATFV